VISENASGSNEVPMPTTPGQWFVTRDSGGYSIETDQVRIVCLGCVDECAAGDANLMAAAPAMLAALRCAVSAIDRWLESGVPASPDESEAIYDQMQDAIYCALGQTTKCQTTR